MSGRLSDGVGDADEHARRSRNLADQVAEQPATGRAGSRGGPPIWVMHAEGFGLMPSRDGLDALLRLSRNTAEKNSHQQRGAIEAERNQADPDGFAVFGRFPNGFLRHLLKLQLLGDVKRDEVLHVCSGTLMERWTVDVRADARPRVQADGKALPFRDCTFKAVLIDPPYSDVYARNLYGIENPRPSWLLREAARVVRPGGRIGFLHVAIPYAPPGCRLVRVWPVSTGRRLPHPRSDDLRARPVGARVVSDG